MAHIDKIIRFRMKFINLAQRVWSASAVTIPASSLLIRFKPCCIRRACKQAQATSSNIKQRLQSQRREHRRLTVNREACLLQSCIEDLLYTCTYGQPCIHTAVMLSTALQIFLKEMKQACMYIF